MIGAPLAGLRVLVTRPRASSESLCDRIRAAGGQAIVIPAIGIEAVSGGGEIDRAIGRLDEYDWALFASANAVEAFFSRLESRLSAEDVARAIGRLPMAAIGAATARAIVARGASVSALPEEQLSAALADALGDVRGLRILIPCSTIARKELGDSLRGKGASVDELAVYANVPAAFDAEALAELERGFDAVLFASPSAARNFAAASGGPARLGDALIVCIGPVTAEEAGKCGYSVGLVADAHDADGLVAALVGHFRDRIAIP